MNQIAHALQPKHTAPPAADPALQRSISSLIQFTPSDGSPVELAAVPPAHVLAAVRERAAVLDHALDQHDQEAAKLAVTGLLAIYARGRHAVDDARMTVMGYLAVLRDVPAFAVLGACRAWASGEAAGQKAGWPPSTDELRTAALAILRPWRTERAKLAQFLNAKQIAAPTTNERARVAKGFDDLAKELGAAQSDAAERRSAMTRELDKLHMRNCAALGIDPEFGITPALAARLKEMRAEDQEGESE